MTAVRGRSRAELSVSQRTPAGSVRWWDWVARNTAGPLSRSVRNRAGVPGSAAAKGWFVDYLVLDEVLLCHDSA